MVIQSAASGVLGELAVVDEEDVRRIVTGKVGSYLAVIVGLPRRVVDRNVNVGVSGLESRDNPLIGRLLGWITPKCEAERGGLLRPCCHVIVERGAEGRHQGQHAP